MRLRVRFVGGSWKVRGRFEDDGRAFAARRQRAHLPFNRPPRQERWLSAASKRLQVVRQREGEKRSLPHALPLEGVAALAAARHARDGTARRHARGVGIEQGLLCVCVCVFAHI